MDPKQLALQYKDALNATGAFVVQPDGQVKMADNRGGGYAPPWVWAGAIPPASGNDAQSQALRVKLSTPASDPSSPWHSMYQEGGPFTQRSQWDSSKGTYEGGIDWPLVLTTAGAGGIIAAPFVTGAIGPGLFGSGAGGASGSAALAGDEAATGGFAPLSAPSVAAGGKVGVGSALAGIGKNVASNTAKNAVSNATGGGNKTAEVLTLLAGLLGGRAFAQAGASNNVPPQLSQLLDIGTQRAAAQQPTFNAVNQGIFSMLPHGATQGIAPPTPSGITSTPQTQSSGSGMNPALLAALGVGGGIGLGGLLTGTNPYGSLITGLKKLFGGGSDTGGVPIPGEEFDPTKMYGG